ncbi:MAG: RHS repeat protein [Acidobacteria bacterium]|nr:MAG: RHS repeat protein [Acidobacteriota bacterium]
MEKGDKTNEVKTTKRKLIEWTIFGIIAIGLAFFMRWFAPWVVLRIEVATGMVKLVPWRVDPALRRRLREEEDRLAKATPAALHGPSGINPCMVLPVGEGISEKPSRGGPAPTGSGPSQPASPIRDCLDLVPGGGPVNAVELYLDTVTVMFVQTDLYLPGDPPIAFTHVVQRYVDWNSDHQVYLPDEYLTFPTGHRNPYTDQTLWFADRRGVLFNRISKGTGYTDAVYKPGSAGSLFDNALAGWNGNGWDYDLPDGRTIVFPDSYYSQRPQEDALVGLIEPSGASLTFDRDRQGNLHEVRSSDGRWLKLRYQGPIIVSIKDSSGENAAYAYDEKRRLSRSTNASGETLSYSYDASGGLEEVENVKTHQRVLSVHYASHRFPTSIQVDGGPVFRVSTGLDFRDDHGHEWFAKCAEFTDSGCQYVVMTK